MVVRSRKLEAQYWKIFEDQFDIFAGAAERPEISKRDLQYLTRYLDPVTGPTGAYERHLRGLSSQSGPPPQDPKPPVVLTPVSHPSASIAVGNWTERSRVMDLNGLDVSREAVTPVMSPMEKKRNGLNYNFLAVSPINSEERDRNYNLSPMSKGPEASPAEPGSMNWTQELAAVNGLISATGTRKRKAVSPVGGRVPWPPSALVPPICQPVSELKRAKVEYSNKLRSRGRSGDFEK